MPVKREFCERGYYYIWTHERPLRKSNATDIKVPLNVWTENT